MLMVREEYFGATVWDYISGCIWQVNGDLLDIIRKYITSPSLLEDQQIMFLEDTFKINRKFLGFEPIIHYKELHQNYLSAPESIIIRLTSRCNLNCIGCYQNKSTEEDADLAMVKNIIQEASHWGVCRLQFGGGEPFLYRYFFKIAKYAYEKKIFTSVCSNGILLNKDVISECKKCGIGHIQISINNPNNTSLFSDKIILVAIELLSSMKIKFGFNVILTKEIFNNIDKVINDLLKLNPNNIKFLMVKPANNNASWYHLNKIDVLSYKNQKKLKEIISLNEKITVDCSLGVLLHGVNGLGCLAASRSLVILPSGNIIACPFWHEYCLKDSVKSYKSLLDLWNHSMVLQKCRCNQCLKKSSYCEDIFINNECLLINEIKNPSKYENFI